jgi:hypothetical protein
VEAAEKKYAAVALRIRRGSADLEPRAGGRYGAGIGALAALVKIFGLRQGGADAAQFWELAEAALAFALLCAGAAALRNFLARRLVWPQSRAARH